MAKIPQAVLDVAEDRSKIGGKLVEFGTHEGRTVYSYTYDDDTATIGVPLAYLWDGRTVEKVYGEQFLELG